MRGNTFPTTPLFDSRLTSLNNNTTQKGGIIIERVTGIEPVAQPWEGRILPLYYTRK